MSRAQMLLALGVGRSFAGLSLLAMPERVGVAWGGRQGGGAAGRTFVRALGARDFGLGAGLLAAHRRGDDLQTWLTAGVVADAVDLGATLAAGDALPRLGRAGVVAAAGSGAAGGLFLLLTSGRD